MVVHIKADRSAVYVVSIPRDSWVRIPGYGVNKINAAFSFGGPSLFVRTIESVTNVRMGHLAVVDWAGLIRIIDSFGGVELTFDEPTVTREGMIPAGSHVLSGEEALGYMRTRNELPNDDFDRIKRQHNVMRAVFNSLLDSGSLADPIGLASTAKSVARALSVDDALSLTAMARIA